jgi:hypothetical protein
MGRKSEGCWMLVWLGRNERLIEEERFQEEEEEEVYMQLRAVRFTLVKDTTIRTDNKGE